MQDPRITDLTDIFIAGYHIRTTLAENKTSELFRRFMPEKKQLSHAVNNHIYSVQIYDSPDSLKKFTPHSPFTKWAGVKVENNKAALPGEMEILTIPAGQYAVFIHKGRADSFPKTMQYIFGEWLPASDYELDDRPHFEVMGEKYLGHNNPDSQEEAWIPIRTSGN